MLNPSGHAVMMAIYLLRATTANEKHRLDRSLIPMVFLCFPAPVNLIVRSHVKLCFREGREVALASEKWSLYPLPNKI